jgi:hypothetical protein
VWTSDDKYEDWLKMGFQNENAHDGIGEWKAVGLTLLLMAAVALAAVAAT